MMNNKGLKLIHKTLHLLDFGYKYALGLKKSPMEQMIDGRVYTHLE